MTTRRNIVANIDAAKARAEAVFHKRSSGSTKVQSATDDYVGKQEAERDKTARLRSERLAREAIKPAR
jgi:hypothetical protein